MSRRFIALIAFLLCFTLFLGCQPAPTNPGTTQPTNTTTTTTVYNGPDETAYIQSLLKPNETLTINSTFRIEGSIIPPSGSSISFGPSGKFVRSLEAPLNNGTNPVIILQNSNVTLNNPRIEGPNPCYWTYFDTGYKYSKYETNKEWHHAISILGGSNYVINNPKITSVFGDAINIDRGPSNITIRNLDANCVGRSIVSNTGSTNVKILGGKSFGAFWWTFNIEPFGSRLVKDYYVENFQVGFSRGQYIFAGGPNFNCNIQNVDFVNINFTSFNDETSIQSCVLNQIDF